MVKTYDCFLSVPKMVDKDYDSYLAIDTRNIFIDLYNEYQRHDPSVYTLHCDWQLFQQLITKTIMIEDDQHPFKTFITLPEMDTTSLDGGYMMKLKETRAEMKYEYSGKYLDEATAYYDKYIKLWSKYNVEPTKDELKDDRESQRSYERKQKKAFEKFMLDIIKERLLNGDIAYWSNLNVRE